jgi:Fic-DOC domain mobile mystery protein B
VTGRGFGVSDEHAWNAQGPDGATPITPEEAKELRPTYIATRRELNDAERANIAEALRRPRWHRLSVDRLLDDLQLRRLHREMFGSVWLWAGQYRTTERNIGSDPRSVSVEVRDLVLNSRFWFAKDSCMPLDEAGCRLHHDLVWIHPFANGNGRHARAITDLVIRAAGGTAFTWGGRSLDEVSATRTRYIAAVRAADRGELGPLLEFVRT